MRRCSGAILAPLVGIHRYFIAWRYPTAFLEKDEPLRERSPQHSVSTKGLGPCASQPGGPFSAKTALEGARRSPCNAESCNLRPPGSSTREAYPHRRPLRPSCDGPRSGSQTLRSHIEDQKGSIYRAYSSRARSRTPDTPPPISTARWFRIIRSSTVSGRGASLNAWLIHAANLGAPTRIRQPLEEILNPWGWCPGRISDSR